MNAPRSNSPSPGGHGDGKSLVLEAVDLVQLVGETVKLKRSGRRYSGLCPFHNEKSPSFSVDPDKQFFYCFGCKKGGNAIDFVIERDRTDFRTALQTLADWAGVQLPSFGGSRETSRRQLMLDAHATAADVYHELLFSDVGKPALAYLRSRGYTDETIKAWQLGFAPDGWDMLTSHKSMRKFGAELLIEAALAKPGRNGGVYDTFRNRVIFPIRDEQGRTIAFGGRILPGDDNPAKYLNSPESPIFSKSRVVFGLDRAKKAIIDKRSVVVVEGYADVISAHQHGADHVVCCMGTALTREHASALRRFADKIVLLFDADTAGGAATKRSVELFLHEPVEIAVAALPAGVDPDEYLNEHGREAFDALLDGAVDALGYAWSLMRKQFVASEQDVTGQQKAVEEYLRILAEARRGGPVDGLRWGAALARVAKLTQIPAEQLHRRLSSDGPRPRPASRRQGQPRPAPVPKAPNATNVPPARRRAEGMLLGAMFNDPTLWEEVQAGWDAEEFEDRQMRWLAIRYWDVRRHEGEVEFAELLDVLQLPGAKALAIELAERAAELGQPRELAGEAVRYLTTQRDRRNEQLSSPPAETEEERLRRVADQEARRQQQIREGRRLLNDRL